MGRNSCDILGVLRRKNKRKMARPGLMQWLDAANNSRSGRELQASNPSSGGEAEPRDGTRMRNIDETQQKK
jgi:hypothetical protein